MPFGDPSSPGRGVVVDRATLSMAGRPRLLDELAVESIRSVHGTDTVESVGRKQCVRDRYRMAGTPRGPVRLLLKSNRNRRIEKLWGER
jgi:hypothetical protein